MIIVGLAVVTLDKELSSSPFITNSAMLLEVAIILFFADIGRKRSFRSTWLERLSSLENVATHELLDDISCKLPF